jgi:Glycosyl transferase 4-like domain
MNPARRILVIQTQAENAGAQKISRLIGAGLVARGFEVHHPFFFRKTRSFDAPPNTSYCVPNRPGTPLALLRFLWRLGRQIQLLHPDAVLTFQHHGNAIGGPVSKLVSPATVIANHVTARWVMPWLPRLADVAMGSLGFFQCITVNSLDLLHEYSRYPRSNRARIKHVPHGFEQKSSGLCKRAARQAFDLPTDAVLLGSVARLHPGKRLDGAIHLWADQLHWHLAIGRVAQQASPT